MEITIKDLGFKEFKVKGGWSVCRWKWVQKEGTKLSSLGKTPWRAESAGVRWVPV